MPAATGSIQLQVAVELRSEIRHMGQWPYTHWQLAALEPETEAVVASSTPEIRGEGTARYFRWRGRPLTLYRDAGEGYWYNLSGSQPSVFVVCRQDEDGDERPLFPFLVTVNHDEAAAHLETDDTVLSIVMPETVREWLERFVAEHYRPERKKKRQRTAWAGQEEKRDQPRTQRPVRDD